MTFRSLRADISFIQVSFFSLNFVLKKLNWNGWLFFGFQIVFGNGFRPRGGTNVCNVNQNVHRSNSEGSIWLKATTPSMNVDPRSIRWLYKFAVLVRIINWCNLWFIYTMQKIHASTVHAEIASKTKFFHACKFSKTCKKILEIQKIFLNVQNLHAFSA